MNKICFFCNQEIKDDEKCKMEAIEGKYPNQYGNIFFHKDICYRKIENISQYLNNNINRIYETISKDGNSRIGNKININSLEPLKLIEETKISDKTMSVKRSKQKNIKRKR